MIAQVTALHLPGAGTRQPHPQGCRTDALTHGAINKPMTTNDARPSCVHQGRIEPVVDPQLPREQAGFRRGRSTVDQVTLLTQDIEDSFQAKEKVGVVLLDLTAAYDTVWHRGLHLKLLRTIPDRHMVKFIMEMLSNRSFILRTSDGQRSRLRRLRNGVPQGSVLSPLLFNIYIHDLPETTSRQYGYADDLAIMLRRTTWSAVEQGLNQDMSILAAYLRKWRLQLSTGKTVSAAYHLCNGEAKRELSVSVDNKRLEHQLAPKYLGVRLDRTLSYKRHLEEVRAKVTARVSLIRRLAGTTWGASARTLRISTQALVFSAAEYCAPVWSRSPHVKKTNLKDLGVGEQDGDERKEYTQKYAINPIYIIYCGIRTRQFDNIIVVAKESVNDVPT
ncbi:hypothetical protein NHX12_008095 [Muraenolepis orangiensis]|uniref:Reverse transcriptase domain-containing protein n=1 Tax=Muraenolepis orangiensis TaxID=630683 RepID=A0A9Q0IAY4_9TELE|nr:hypothetical protein NHX12_008095 [Muraenolepis orangiensis]